MLDKSSVFMKDTGRVDIVEVTRLTRTRWSTRWFPKEKAWRFVRMMQAGKYREWQAIYDAETTKIANGKAWTSSSCLHVFSLRVT